MKFATYEEAYAALGIEQGAQVDYFDVKRAWRYLVKYHHPDTFNNDTLRAEATERLKRYNAAYEHLKRYWETNNAMPARGRRKYENWNSGSGAETSSHSDARQDGAKNAKQHTDSTGTTGGAPPGTSGNSEESAYKTDRDAFWEAYNKGKNPGGKSAEDTFWEDLDKNHPSPKADRHVSFGPQPPPKTSLHKIFDKMDFWEHDPDTVWLVMAIYIGTFIGLGAITIGAWRAVMNLLDLNLTQVADSPVGGMLILTSSYIAYYVFYFGWYYSYKTYKLMQHPFIDMSYPAAPNAVLEKIRQGLASLKFKWGDWEIGAMSVDEQGIWTLSGVMCVFETKNGGFKKEMKLIVKVWERNDDLSAVTFWFEETHDRWFKRIAANVLNKTNDSLRTALGVAHPNYRKPVP